MSKTGATSRAALAAAAKAKLTGVGGDQDDDKPTGDGGDSGSTPAVPESHHTGHDFDALCDVVDRIIDRVTWDGDDGARREAHRLVDEARSS